MQKIDIHNYEAYLLDFSEGNLTDELQMELELFLIQHPELNIDLAELSFASLKEDEITFSEKNNLKKSEADLITETQFISYIENQLSLQERSMLEKSCALNTSLSKELALYQNTISRADTSIVYADKNELKRKSKIIWFNSSNAQYAAAACVLFFIGLFILWPKTENNVSQSMLANNPDIHQAPAKHNAAVPAIKIQVPDISAKTKQPTLRSSSIKVNQPLPANSITTQQPSAPTNSYTNKIDTNHIEPIEQHNNPLLAQNIVPVVKPVSQTIVETITENEDEAPVLIPEKKKKGLWANASRALKNLNNAGVKSVNGNEEDGKNKTSYALTLGGISITHKAGNL